MDVSNLDVSQVTNATGMFENCTAVSILMNNWNTSNMVRCDNMFRRCINLKAIDFSSWNTSKVVSFRDFIAFSSSLSKLDVRNFDTSNCTVLFRMFGICDNLQEIIGLENFKTSKCIDFAGMFQRTNIQVIDVSNFDTSSAHAMNFMFGGNTALQKIVGLNSFDTSNVINFNDMFRGCTNLEELDLSSFNTKSAKYMSNMFTNSSKLKTIYASSAFENFDKNYIQDNILFDNCNSLIGGSGTVWNPTYIDSTAAKIDGGPNSPGYFTYKEPSTTTQSLEMVIISPIKDDETSSEETQE